MLPAPSDSSEPSVPLLPPSPSSISYPPISFIPSPRPLRDLPSLLLFLLLSLSTFALGILSIIRHNPNHNPSCTQTHTQNLTHSLSFSPLLTKNLAWTLTITAVAAVPIALLLLSLLRRFARQIVYAFVPLFIIVPSFLNFYWFFACRRCSEFPLPYRILTLIFVFILIAIFAWIVVANWHRIELTIRIVRISAAALAENVALVAVLPLLWAALAVYFVPVVVFLVFARENGRFVEREEQEVGVRDCVWKEEEWVPAYFALAIVTMIWTVATMVEAQVYVISGTIAQWYFAEEGSRPRRSIRSSMR